MTSTAPAEATSAPVATRHFALAVFALAVGGFAIGTTEFVTMGVLPQISDGVDVSVTTAGRLISAYALGAVVGVPVLSFFCTGLPRRGLLLALMGAYAAFNGLSAAAPGYHVLLGARFLDGVPHGAYFGVASLVAAGMAVPERKGRAVAMVMLGLSVANVIGVPAATWLGQHAGWRAAYVAAAAVSLLAVALIGAYVPRVPGDPEATGRKEAGEFFTNVQVWLTMAAGAIGFGGMFAVYSYIAPIVTDTGGLADSAVPWFVLAFGLGMVAGTWVAGELARWSVVRSLLLSSVGLAAVLILVWAVAPQGWWLWPAAFAMTGVSSVLVVNLQLRLMDVAGGAVTLGAAMNHASLNVGNALGAYLGGLALAAWGERTTPLVGAALALAGTVVLVWSATLHRRSASERPTPRG